MYIQSIKRILLISCAFMLAACSSFSPAPEVQTSLPVIEIQSPIIPVTQTQINANQCEVKCGQKSGIKKKLCIKKCQLGIKRAQAKKDALNAE